MKKSDVEPPLEPPIPFRHGSNGEFVPREATDLDRRAEALYFQLVEERARRLDVSRRSFVESFAGAATALFVINQVYGCSENGAGLGDAGRDAGGSDAEPGMDAPSADAPAPDGGRYDVDAEATEDAGVACDQLSGDEFIFDVQTHHVNPAGAWRGSGGAGWEFFLRSLPQGACGLADGVDCFDVVPYLREMFVNSDTSMAVLSAVPADPGRNPLETAEAAATRAIVDRAGGEGRLVIHGLVLPDQGQAQLDGMDRLKEEDGVVAWKVYTPYGGWRLDDPAIGLPFIEKARSLGIKRICAHKGLPLFGFDPNFASPDDIGVVAAMYPDVTFIVYHSGYETSIAEGAYNGASPEGIDRLIKTLLDNNIAPNSNVYAELGSTWRNVMTRPAEAGHVIGKLLRYVGEDRVLWGTDSIWHGTPQDQIMAFRALTYSDDFAAMYGYPPLTADIKRKVFGMNAVAAYGVQQTAVRCRMREEDLTGLGFAPTFRRYGPQSRREFFAFLRSRGGMPG